MPSLSAGCSEIALNSSHATRMFRLIAQFFSVGRDFPLGRDGVGAEEKTYHPRLRSILPEWYQKERQHGGKMP